MIEPTAPEQKPNPPRHLTAVEFNADIAACRQCDNAPRCFCAKHLAMAPSVVS